MPHESFSTPIHVNTVLTLVTLQDVNEIMGNSPYPAGGLGGSASGRISAIGPDVKEFAVGDRVIALGAGSLSSHLRVPEMLVEKIPENMTFEEAATLPSSFGTAMAALQMAGNLQAGQVSCPSAQQ